MVQFWFSFGSVMVQFVVLLKFAWFSFGSVLVQTEPKLNHVVFGPTSIFMRIMLKINKNDKLAHIFNTASLYPQIHKYMAGISEVRSSDRHQCNADGCNSQCCNQRMATTLCKLCKLYQQWMIVDNDGILQLVLLSDTYLEHSIILT